MKIRTLLIVTLAALMLGACSFHLRGQAELPFASAYVDEPTGSPLAVQLKRSLKASGRTVTDKAQDAQVVIRLTGASRSKSILSLSGGGRVKEYRLEYKVGMTVLSPDGRVLLPPSDTQLVRDYTYDDRAILAKEGEEAYLFQAMEQDALRSILIRLRFVKLEGATAAP